MCQVHFDVFLSDPVPIFAPGSFDALVMNKKFHLISFALVVLLSIVFQQSAQATTWDEPWHESVIKKADSFGLFIVDDNKSDTASLTLLKHLAGKVTPAKIVLNGFYLLKLNSLSGGHPPSYEMALEKGKKYYLFLKEKSKGQRQMPTPTAGVNRIMDDGRIEAVYRISPHAAAVAPELFEKTQTCVFNYLHREPCKPLKEIKRFIGATLQKPAGKIEGGIDSEQSTRFFEQHVALESAYMLDIPLEESVLSKFLENDFAHVQISGIRALVKSKSESKGSKLVKIIESKDTSPTVKVFAVLALEQINDRSVIPQLQKLEKSLLEDQAGLGLNIMDPRIATRFPESTKKAIRELLGKWNSSSLKH